MSRDDRAPQPESCAGFRMRPETLRAWIERASRRAAGAPLRRVLDVGCGTGRFAPHLADALRSQVVAFDRSELVLGIACEEHAHPRVAYVRADAARLPFRDACFGVAWLSMVVPTMGDLDAAGRELSRVLAAGGVVLVRSVFRETLGDALRHRLFPSALAEDRTRVPSFAEFRRAFEGGGLAIVSREGVEQEVDPDAATHAERLRVRAGPGLEAVPDDEFSAGIVALEELAASGALRGPVTETIDFVTLVRPG